MIQTWNNQSTHSSVIVAVPSRQMALPEEVTNISMSIADVNAEVLMSGLAVYPGMFVRLSSAVVTCTGVASKRGVSGKGYDSCLCIAHLQLIRLRASVPWNISDSTFSHITREAPRQVPCKSRKVHREKSIFMSPIDCENWNLFDCKC